MTSTAQARLLDLFGIELPDGKKKAKTVVDVDEPQAAAETLTSEPDDKKA